MKPDRWGARADYEYDMIQEARWLRHQDGECPGAPVCAWCLDEQNDNDTNEKGNKDMKTNETKLNIPFALLDNAEDELEQVKVELLETQLVSEQLTALYQQALAERDELAAALTRTLNIAIGFAAEARGEDQESIEEYSWCQKARAALAKLEDK